MRRPGSDGPDAARRSPAASGRPRSASSATFAFNSPENRRRLLLICIPPSGGGIHLSDLSDFPGPPQNDRRWECVIESKYFEISASITHRWRCSMMPVTQFAEGIVRRPSAPEAVRARQKVRLVDRLQKHQDRPLRHLVFKRRDAEGAFRAVRFRDVVASHRRRAIAARLDPAQEAFEIGLQGPFRSRQPSRRRCPSPHPCASGDTPHASTRRRSDGAGT